MLLNSTNVALNPQVNCLNNYANICFDFAGVLTRIDKINIDFILQILICNLFFYFVDLNSSNTPISTYQFVLYFFLENILSFCFCILYSPTYISMQRAHQH